MGRIAKAWLGLGLGLVLVLASGGSASADEARPIVVPPPVTSSAPPEGGNSAEASAPAEEPKPSENIAPAESAFPIDVHGFVSQGFIKTTENNYLANSKHGSFEFSEVGVNFSKSLGDRLRVGLQFFARDLGAVGNYTPKFDWFHLDYRFTDWLGFRAGRLKVPFGLYNEVNDVDSSRVPVLLPQSVYPILNRDILLAQTGAEIYGYVRLKPIGALEYRLYGGTLFIEPPAKPPLQLRDFQVPYVVGGRAMWEPPIEGLRAGASVQTLRFDTTYGFPAAPNMPPLPDLKIGIPFVLWLASVEYAAHDLTVAAEFGRWRADVETALGPISQTETVVNRRYYVMASYHLTPWFTPGAYYSSLVENVDKPLVRSNFQEDVAVTLRFDLTEHWLFKLEGHYMHGTLDLSSELNGGTPKNELTRDWAAFFAKTTAYF